MIERSGRNGGRAAVAVAGALLALATIATFANGVRGAFLFDDRAAIVFNGSIRQLTTAFSPPPATTVAGRPALNLSFALDYAFHGPRALGFHVTNIAIHVAAALTLFGLVRRSLRRPGNDPRAQHHAGAIAWFAALLWALHPVQTESVTYLVQRAEALMSLFLLLTLYTFARSAESARPTPWRVAMVIACALGMATKESMACVPFLVLLYDRAFYAGSLREAWRRHGRWYVALAATWAILGVLVLSTGGNRGGSVVVQLGLNTVAAQGIALVRYVALLLWPHPLILDYGPAAPLSPTATLFAVTILFTAASAAVYALVRHPRAGVLVAAVFGALAPTMFVTTQFMAEHRLYLPSAAAAIVVAWLGVRTGRLAPVLGATAAVALATVTVVRNSVYRSEVAIWTDAVAKRPGNAIAHSSLGAALAEAGERERAIVEYRAALALRPNHVPALANLALVLTESGNAAEALPFAERAVALEPTSAQAQLHLALTQEQLHREGEALDHYAAAVRLMPLMPQARNDYGAALVRAGKVPEGLAELRAALALDPTYVFAHLNLGSALLEQGDLDAAQAEFERAMALQPNDVNAPTAWATQLARHHHPQEAETVFERVLSRAPQSPEVHYEHGNALAIGGRMAEAAAEFETAVNLRPTFVAARTALGDALMALNRAADAIHAYRAALAADPDDPLTHNSLGIAFAKSGRLREALAEFETAVQLNPKYDNARANLARAQAALGGS